MSFQPPTIAWRGQLAQLVAQVQAKLPKNGVAQGTMPCMCGATLFWRIDANGSSYAHCSAGCGARWNR